MKKTNQLEGIQSHFCIWPPYDGTLNCDQLFRKRPCFALRNHQNRFRPGLHLRPCWGSLRLSPRPRGRLGKGIPLPIPQKSNTYNDELKPWSFTPYMIQAVNRSGPFCATLESLLLEWCKDDNINCLTNQPIIITSQEQRHRHNLLTHVKIENGG